MELEKKTTILFPRDQHEFLVRLARQRGVSMGHLVRSACEAQFQYIPTEARLRAVEELYKMSLPVGTVHEMKQQSVVSHEELLPE